jgi:hypothetical protein
MPCMIKISKVYQSNDLFNPIQAGSGECSQLWEAYSLRVPRAQDQKVREGPLTKGGHKIVISLTVTFNR